MATPGWRPNLNGKRLAPLDTYNALVKMGLEPDDQRDPQWSEACLLDSIPMVPAREDIRESLLALWRLRFGKGKEPGDLWMNHVAAWIVRSSSLLFFLTTNHL